MKYTQNLLRLIVENQKMDINEIVEYLGQIGVINDLLTQRSLIKIEFTKRRGKDLSGNKIIMDLAVKYNCSIPHVINCIYKHPEIKT